METIHIIAGPYAPNLAGLIAERLQLLSPLSLSTSYKVEGDVVCIQWERDEYIDLVKKDCPCGGRTPSGPSVGPCPQPDLQGTPRSVLRLFVCAVLSRLIREQVAVEYMAAVVNEVCKRFTPEEKASILDSGVRLAYAEAASDTYYHIGSPVESAVGELRLSGNEAVELGAESGVDGLFIRVDDVFLRIFDYLNEHNVVILDGFIRFRLRFFLDRLRRSAYRAIDDFLLQREYEEFVQLLRYLVDIQSPRMETVTIVRNRRGFLQLYDDAGGRIDTESLLSDAGDLFERDLNVEDILISLLIALSPGKVLLCLRGGQLLFETTMDVFRGRIVVCDGCATCRQFGDINQ